MSLITVPNTFSAGAVIVASQHNSNFTTIYSDYNGNIDNNNLAAGAAIAYTKLNLTGNIVNADINASAAIVDTKLSQITTASKVSGTAITGLASVPAGAGVLPIANIGTGATATNFLRGDGTFAVAGSVALVSNTSIAAATNSGDIAITSTKYYMVVINITAATAADDLNMRFNNDTGANYKWVSRGFQIDGTAINSNGTGAALIKAFPAIGVSGSTSVNLVFYIPPYSSAVGQLVKGTYYGFGNAGVNYCYGDFMGQWAPGAATTSFRILATNNLTGNVIVYEMKTA